MSLSNNHIILRAPELTDLDDLFRWENDESIWYLSNTLIPFSRFDLEQFILNSNHDIYTEKQYRFMIEVKNKKTVVGCIDLFDFDPHNQRAGIGILIDKDYREQGLASESLDLIISYAFDDLKLHQLYCNILSSNLDSIFLFKKKQFLEIGVKKDWVFLHGEYQDEILLQLIK
ncbi:MAG: GNAT family N-acetyltransferase [Bacteroidales bacterium]|nr:GNAT family N-acetyltransferase [Bacteroidales bacterium]